MEEIISRCGILCHTCGAYIATINDDDEKRTEIAKEWTQAYKSDIKPEDINCLSCISENEPTFAYCKQCKIRACANGKKVLNCAYCDDYVCDILEEFFKMVPDNRKRLDEIRSKI